MSFEEPTGLGPREVTDPRTMRALAHPLRIALLEMLTVDGPLTATEAAERLGESPANCSFHLRQLAKYHFVEETRGGRGGRHRPWRLTQVGMRFSDLHEDAQTRVAASLLDQVLVDRYLARYQASRRVRHTHPREWQEVTGQSEFLLWVTPEELRAVTEEVEAVLRRHADRLANTELRPEGSRPIEVLLFAFPFERPGAGV
jgi:DNA-binding MarR family transcriptional regulator